jgi:hypothetical protein
MVLSLVEMLASAGVGAILGCIFAGMGHNEWFTIPWAIWKSTN